MSVYVYVHICAHEQAVHIYQSFSFHLCLYTSLTRRVFFTIQSTIVRK